MLSCRVDENMDRLQVFMDVFNDKVCMRCRKALSRLYVSSMTCLTKYSENVDSLKIAS
jgi:hypothetical protein